MATETDFTECPILTLPLDIILDICEYLEDREVLRLGQTCTAFYDVTQHSVVWRYLSLQRWGFCNIKATPTCPNRWKMYYSKRRMVEVKMNTGKAGNYQVRTLRGHDDVITDSLYVKLGEETKIDNFQLSNVISGSSDGTVRLWDVENKKCISICKIDSAITCLVTSPDSTEVIAGDEMGRLTRLKLPSLEIVRGIETNNSVISLQYIASCVKDICNLFISCHQDGSVLFWKDFEKKESVDPSRTLHTGGYYPHCTKEQLRVLVNTNQTKAVIFAHDKDDIDVLDFAKISSECPEPECLITRLQLTNHGLDAGWVKGSKTPLFICLEVNTICLFEIDNSKNPLNAWIHPINIFKHFIFNCLAMCPGREFVVGGNHGQIQQFTITAEKTIQLVKEFNDHKSMVRAVFATGCRVMSCSNDFSIRVYVWKKEGHRRVLESKYTLLGGSLAINACPLFSHVVHDDVSCVGTNGKLLKVYVFQE